MRNQESHLTDDLEQVQSSDFNDISLEKRKFQVTGYFKRQETR